MDEPSTTDETDPLIGQSVGGYRVEGLLGMGGMGRVYRAVADDGTVVALKLVRSDLAQDTVFRRRFEREASIAQTVSNPHVVPVLDTGEHEGVPYLSQQFIQGGSLADRIDREGKLEIAAALGICHQVAAGLDALYVAGMVHRDVKPANVLLDDDGTAYITDFGLVKDLQATNLTRPGQTLGSLDYMAPEQIRGEDVTAATDVYALGCVVFECLSGGPPFDGRKGMRLLWAQLQETPGDPCADRPDAPAGLGTAVLRALEKEPEDRPQSASEYARLLYDAAGLQPPAS